MNYQLGAQLTPEFQDLVQRKRLVPTKGPGKRQHVPPKLPSSTAESGKDETPESRRQKARGFRAAAAVVADDIRRTSSRLTELTRLARRPALDSRTQSRIDMLAGAIKADLTRVGSTLDTLEEEAEMARQSPRPGDRAGSAGASAAGGVQVSAHGRAIVGSLRQALLGATSDFSGVLQNHTQAMQTASERRARLGVGLRGGVGGRPMGAFAGRRKSDGPGRQGQGQDQGTGGSHSLLSSSSLGGGGPESAGGRRFGERERAGNGGKGSDRSGGGGGGGGDVRASLLGAGSLRVVGASNTGRMGGTPTPRSAVPDLEGGSGAPDFAPLSQQELQMVDRQRGGEVATARADAVEGVQRHVQELSGMFHRLSTLIAQQSEQVERIETDVGTAVERIDMGRRDIEQAHEAEHDSTWLLARVGTVVLGFAAAYVVFLA